MLLAHPNKTYQWMVKQPFYFFQSWLFILYVYKILVGSMFYEFLRCVHLFQCFSKSVGTSLGFNFQLTETTFGFQSLFIWKSSWNNLIFQALIWCQFFTINERQIRHWDRVLFAEFLLAFLGLIKLKQFLFHFLKTLVFIWFLIFNL